ncbi:hypothetical protein MY7_3342 [Bacillus sp. 5B6]|nr:hypothetical protein MY7_3342 [Bacillus sp. 5B6]
MPHRNICSIMKISIFSYYRIYIHVREGFDRKKPHSFSE